MSTGQHILWCKQTAKAHIPPPPPHTHTHKRSHTCTRAHRYVHTRWKCRLAIRKVAAYITPLIAARMSSIALGARGSSDEAKKVPTNKFLTTSLIINYYRYTQAESVPVKHKISYRRVVAAGVSTTGSLRPLTQVQSLREPLHFATKFIQFSCCPLYVL
jgi:hypothetical protein